MKVLVANRGEIACRVLRTLRALSIPSVAVYSEVDANSAHVWLADDAVALGDVRSYLDIPKVITAAKAQGATAIHPGYGFLSENPSFAAACAEAGLVFIGPSAEVIRAFGDKREAALLAAQHNVPVIPGASPVDSVDEARARAESAGFPVVIKAAAGGGGKGMRKVTRADVLADAYASATREAQAAFGDGRLLVEKFIDPARHVEVQILGDGRQAVALGERECSLQRRYQKVLEESPSPGIDDTIREALEISAVTLAEAVGYCGAGTVEFLVGPDGAHYFLEVNTRLQVEHPVTEMRLGWDLVEQQIAVAHGDVLSPPPEPRGHAIEVRLNAEEPYRGFLPATGDALMLRWPQGPGIRVDTGIEEGTSVSPHYDPLIAKMIAWGPHREAARRRLLGALRETVILGVPTNLTFLSELLERPFFIEGKTHTTTLEAETWCAPPVPPEALVVVEQLGEPPPQAQGGRLGDLHSPWDHLGAFRVGR